LHPNVPSGEEDSKLIYLVRDNSATGDDKYKEWIWDSGDPEANPPVSAQWKLIGDTTMHLEGYVQKVQIDGTEIPATSGTVNIPLAVADDYGTSGTDGALSKEDKEKIDSYKYMYLSGGTSGEKIYANSPDLNLDVGFLTLGNTGFGQVPGFVAVGRAGQDECFFGNQGSDPAFGVYDNQSQQFAVKELLTEDSYIISNLQNGKADKVYDATSGNLAALDEDGNLIDSGIDPSQLPSDVEEKFVATLTATSQNNTHTISCDESILDIAEAFYANKDVWIQYTESDIEFRFKVNYIGDMGEDPTTHVHVYTVVAVLPTGEETFLLVGKNYENGAVVPDIWEMTTIDDNEHRHGTTTTGITSTGTMPGTIDATKVLHGDGTWSTLGSFEYEHTNETNTRNVPTNSRHWFNYRNGDTDTVDSDNLITEYHFGNRGGSEKGVNLVADGLTGRTFTSGSNNTAWCIKCTRLADSGRGHIAVRVMLDRSTDTDDFGFIDIVIKFRAGNWHAYAYPFVRRTQATSFGQVLYTMKNGITYIGIRCSGYSSRVVPIILGDNRNNIFNIEFGEFSSEVSSLTFQPLQTRFPVYADYNDNAMAAIGSSTQPVYVNANGKIEPCSISDSHYYGGSAQMSATCAYNYVKAGMTLTVNVATMLNEKTYYAHVVRPDGSSTATITVKFTSSSSFNVYGNSTTITGTTTYTASRGPNPVIFMKNGSNLYILGY
jgi:hypothetical protein